MNGIYVVGLCDQLRRNACCPWHPPITFRASLYGNSLSSRRFGIDHDVDRRCIGTARDVNHPIRVDGTGSNNITNPARFGKLIGIRQDPCNACRLRGGYLAGSNAALRGEILRPKRLPAGHFIGVDRALVRKQLQHSEEAADVVQQLGVGVPEVKQRQLLHERVAADHGADDRVRGNKKATFGATRSKWTRGIVSS